MENDIGENAGAMREEFQSKMGNRDVGVEGRKDNPMPQWIMYVFTFRIHCFRSFS